MRITDRERKQYLSQIKSLLVCSEKERRKFLRDLNENIDEFLKNDPDADMNALQNAMGTPHEIADEFLANVSSKDIKKRMSVVRVAKIAAIILLICVVIFFISSFIKRYKNNRGYGTVTTVVYNDYDINEENATTIDVDSE